MPPSGSETLDEHPDLSAQHGRLGLWLFAVYLALYGGFVGLSAFAPDVMSSSPILDVNLAVLSGLGLIVAALVLALLYTVLCRLATDRHAAQSTSGTQTPDTKGGRQ